MSSFYDILKAAKVGGNLPSYYETLLARKLPCSKYAWQETTITGTPPLSFKANGQPLTSWSISGNTVQNGTPAPDAPIYPEFVGERTGNLFDAKRFVDTAIPVNGTVSLSENTIILSPTDQDAYVNRVYSTQQSVSPNERNCCIPVSPDTGYTIIMENARKSYVSFIGSDYSCVYGYLQITHTTPQEPFTFTTPSDCAYIVIRLGQWVSSTSMQINFPNIMLIEGSEAPSAYIPYGYYLPVSCGGQTVPIYLGQVQTVRNIKKLILTGDENIITSSGYYFITNIRPLCIDRNAFICSHFGVGEYSGQINVGNARFVGSPADSFVINYDGGTGGVENFKQYLSDQYAAGSPVTVWYVLATPETSIVNEPLCKIGNYADELHSEDAGIAIPTVRGSNVLTVDTTLAPSSVSITGKIKEV